MIDLLLQLPTWMIIRVAGIASFGLLTLGMVLGISYNFTFWPKGSKRNLYRVHSFLTISGTAIGLLHGVITVIDKYVPYSWRDLLIPFSSAYAPALSGIGSLSGYGMLLVILTTDLRNKLKRPVWLMFHMLSYPVFIMALVHGFFLGSDSGSPGIRLMYALSVIVVLGLTFARSSLNKRAKDANPQIAVIAHPSSSRSPARSNSPR